jgi:hypothetical protein
MEVIVRCNLMEDSASYSATSSSVNMLRANWLDCSDLCKGQPKSHQLRRSRDTQHGGTPRGQASVQISVAKKRFDKN